MSLTWRWLGAAGLELALDGFVLLVDPFFTRPGKWAVLAGRRVRSDESLAERLAPRAGAVLVTHPHFDHIMDVPSILRRTGAPAFGSPFSRRILGLHGIPETQARAVHVGDRFEAGPFSVDVLPARHTPLPLTRLYHQRLPELPPAAVRPLRLSDYRMDACYSFRIRAGGTTLMVGNHPAPADLLFITPYHPQSYLEEVLAAAKPRIVVPIHWDDFTRPLSLPLKPMLVTPAQVPGPWLPPLRRLDLGAFARASRAVLPEVEVLEPKIFQQVV